MPAAPPARPSDTVRGGGSGSPLEVLRVFLRLGLTSFGGPVAHLGCFRAEFVERRHWLSDADYADLVALCQFLPGPASSQVGMALGLRRAGGWGMLAAWLGFTLPSAAVLILFATAIVQWPGWAHAGAVHGLKVAAVAVVAQAVWGMARTLCTDRPRAGIACGAALCMLTLPTAAAQVGTIIVGGLLGHWLLRLPAQDAGGVPALAGISRRTGAALLMVTGLLLVALPLAAATWPSAWLGATAVFYRAGALVLGGGHVVLPLLEAGVVPPGWVDASTFMAGYGAAQAVPGPLFTFAAYLGAVMPSPLGGWAGGLAMLAVIFLPASLLVAGALPYWEALRRRDGMRRAMAGVNAAVVGVLGAALYDPVWTNAIRSIADVALALVAFGLLVAGRLPPLWVVSGTALAGAMWSG